MADSPGGGAAMAFDNTPITGNAPRRRVSSLLSTYYRMEGDEHSKKGPESPGHARDDNLDGQGFDSERYFDGMIASGQLPDLVQRANVLNTEVKALDADMRMLVYENYIKFIRATDVIKQMKFTIEGLDPDLQGLDGNLDKITKCQQSVEAGVSRRARQVEGLLKQQKLSRKLATLFDLPRILRRCLDRGQYGTAVEAYCNCAQFLRQYEDMKAFKTVLEDVNEQMGRIRCALEHRLRSPELSVDEAVNSCWTLLDVGEDQSKVASEYLSGRCSMLQQSLQRCFDVEAAKRDAEAKVAHLSEMSRDQRELQCPESVALHAACTRIAESYVPSLCSAVEGFSKLQEHRSIGRESTINEDVLSNFVRARVEELCEGLSRLIEQRYPPTRVLVSCVHSVRDALRRLHTLLPQLLTRLFKAFFGRTATYVMKTLLADACSSLVVDLRSLHSECKRLQESKSSGLDDVLEEIAHAEESIIMRSFAALTDCQPLLSLLGSDFAACQQLVHGLQEQSVNLFVTFIEACYAYIGYDVADARASDPALASLPQVATAGLDEVANLGWSGLFGLALVRIGRHLESKVIAKAWAVARELLGVCEASRTEFATNPALIKATRRAAEAMIKHYVLTSGQRLAHFFRNSVQNRNWMTVREPREPRLVVEMVLKEVYAFDTQLARILGDPRKPRAPDARRGVLGHRRRELLDMERLLAKSMPVFAPIPFSRSGAIVGILRIAFKALYEFMREETFAKFGLQQIQVDCAFLGEAIRDFVEVENLGELDSLLDEVIESAKLRCVEPVLMATTVVEVLCDEKKKTFKFE